MGSPPRRRGKPYEETKSVTGERIPPAFAGKTLFDPLLPTLSILQKPHLVYFSGGCHSYSIYVRNTVTGISPQGRPGQRKRPTTRGGSVSIGWDVMYIPRFRQLNALFEIWHQRRNLTLAGKEHLATSQSIKQIKQAQPNYNEGAR